MDRAAIIEGLGHPASPPVDALLTARSALCDLRDSSDEEESEQAKAAIAEIDHALNWLGYKHFTKGGVRWDERHASISAAEAFLTSETVQ